MMETRWSVHEILCRVLTAELDPYLKTNGFERGDNSLDYVRRCDDCAQWLAAAVTSDLSWIQGRMHIFTRGSG